MRDLYGEEVACLFEFELLYFHRNKFSLFMHIVFLFEVAEFNPFADDIHFDILIFIFILLDFVPVILLADLVHLHHCIALTAYDNHVPNSEPKYADIEPNN